MSKTYTVRSGQNLYDVALMLYGSIEGVFDLLISNDGISLQSELATGQTLEYNEEFMINDSLPDWFANKGVIVKNGNHVFNNVSVRQSFVNYVEESNEAIANQFKLKTLTIDYDNGIDIFTDGSYGGMVSFIDECDKWERLGVSAKIRNAEDLLERVQKAIGVEFDDDRLDDRILERNLRDWFSFGMILPPSTTIETTDFYSDLITPKLIIRQTGTNSAIGLQLETNKLVMVDWGDGSDMEFYCYKELRQDISHVYGDSGEHVIRIYGNAEFVNLDFTSLNGTYYPTQNIVINHWFVTPYAEVEGMNRLFVIKENQV